jgi:hypothetical protein
VEFLILETLRGKATSKRLRFTGYAVEHDDYNLGQVPYAGVRPSGLTGACFAYEYRLGAEYLFLLQRDRAGRLTPYWAVLAPVNEQLRGTGDPWLAWVREQMRAKSG